MEEKRENSIKPTKNGNGAASFILKALGAFAAIVATFFGTVQFILNFTVRPLVDEVRDIRKEVNQNTIEIKSIEFLLRNSTNNKYGINMDRLDSLIIALTDTMKVKDERKKRSGLFIY